MGLLNRRKSSDPVAAIERELAAMRERRTALAAKLVAAEAELAKLIEQRRTRLLGG
jgi:hypothetical protein